MITKVGIGICCECQKEYQCYYQDGRWLMNDHWPFGPPCRGIDTVPQAVTLERSIRPLQSSSVLGGPCDEPDDRDGSPVEYTDTPSG